MCTLEKRGRVYLLTLTGDGDQHFLNAPLLNSIHDALTRVRTDTAFCAEGCALVTAAEGKFFSNGLDLAWAKASPADRFQLMGAAFLRVLAALVSFPMPTIAAVTGHAAAGAFFVVLAHDYVVMRGDRGFLYMSEIDVGLPITSSVMSLARAKVSPRPRRDALLRGAKMTAAEAEVRGFVDVVCGSASETVAAALRLGEELAARKWDGHLYASTRLAAFPGMRRILEAVADDGSAPRSKL